MKNRKGFTLVELLAVIVILGILSVFAIPTITRLVSSSREKMYINDTKKFISIAEAKMKGNSSDIDDPDNNKCIIMNLLYLDSKELKHAPNGGEYLKENSFVIIKKNGEDLEYSATLVEKTKDGGYVGTKLIKRDVLNTKAALDYVTGFKKEELLTSANLDSNYINSQFGSNYVSGISKTYYFQDFSGSTYQAVDDSTPGFAVLNIASASHNAFNSVDAVLKVIVEDEDSAPSELSLSITCEDKEKSKKFCDDLASIPMENSYAKQIDIDFSKYDYANVGGGNIYVHVTVQDNQHNKKSKTLEYFLDTNKAPVIDYSKSFVKKRDADKEAMTVASFKLDVADDLDSYTDLQVCLLEDDELESSCDYKSYNDFFREGDIIDYQFHCTGNGCIRDGSTHKLKAYVKDSFGLVTVGEFDYNFSLNEPPVISNNSVSIISTENNYNASKVKVKFSVSDITDASDKLVVHLNSDNNHMEYLYSEADDNGSFAFDFLSLYDGSIKNLTVTVFDTEGLSVSKTVSYQLYKNQKPTISEVKAVSDGTACDAAELCPLSEGGSKNVNLTINAKDDLDDTNDIKMCVSDNRNYCDDIRNYSSYHDNISLELDGSYDGSVKNIYAVVLDSYGLSDESFTTYSLYKNRAPIIKNFDVKSAKNEKPDNGSLEIIISATIDDDFDNREDLLYSLLEDDKPFENLNEQNWYLGLEGGNCVEGEDCEGGMEYKLDGVYDGTNRTIKLVVTDKSGEVSTSSKIYNVYNNQAPVIDSFTITSDGYPCDNPELCPIGDDGNNGNITVEYDITASDDLDNAEDLKVCVSESDECTDYQPYVNYYDPNQEATSKMKWTFSVNNEDKPYDGSEKNLNVFVMDSSGGVTKESKSYTIYKNQEPVLTFDPALMPIDISADLIYSVGYSDDLTNKDDLKIKYCYTVEDVNSSPVCTEPYPYVEVIDIYEGTSGEIEYEDDESNEQDQGDLADSSELKNLMRLNSDNLFADITEFNGQTLNIYSVIEDSYGLVTESNPVSYVLYSDGPSKISFSSVKIEDRYYTDSLNNRVENVEGEINDYTLNLDLNVYFIASDYYDQYMVCLGKSEDQCDSPYSDWYDGFDNSGHHINYTYKVNAGADLTDLPLYIITTDKNNNILSEDIREKINFDDNESTCMSYDLTKNKYQFSPVNNDSVISADYCEGKCYSVNPLTKEVNSKFALYTKKQYRFDRYSDNIMCSPAELNIKVNCSFKDCFYKNNNYQRKAIGFYEVIDQVPWTYTELGEDGKIVSTVANSHYQVYSSSYEEEEIDVYDSNPPRREKVGDDSITLTLTPERVCPNCINKDEYVYSSSSSDSYVRINDFPDYNWGDYYEQVE